MRNVLSVAVVGLLTSISFANASTTETGPVATPTLTPVPYGIKYFCEFEGRGTSEHGHQDRDVRCKAEGLLPLVATAESVGNGDAATRLNNYGGPIKIKCSNGYRLETEYTAIAFQGPNLWINAEKHDKLASILVREFATPSAEVEGRRFRAELLAANNVVIHGEGKCKFEYPLGPPAPPAPSIAE